MALSLHGYERHYVHAGMLVVQTGKKEFSTAQKFSKDGIVREVRLHGKDPVERLAELDKEIETRLDELKLKLA